MIKSQLEWIETTGRSQRHVHKYINNTKVKGKRIKVKGSRFKVQGSRIKDKGQKRRLICSIGLIGLLVK